jgi:hypothetical protein
MNPTQVSDHFSLQEVTHSQTAERLGIPNILPDSLYPVIAKTALGMEKVRAVLGNRAISIDSWYRSPGLNTALGSRSTSQHIKGEAVDFICPSFGSALVICKKLIEYSNLVRFDQLILEHTWVHISWNSNPDGVQRNQVLSLLSNGGYSSGLTDKLGNLL